MEILHYAVSMYLHNGTNTHTFTKDLLQMVIYCTYKLIEAGDMGTWAKDARTILHLLSKGVSIVKSFRNGPPGSITTTYQINPLLD
jgi:hypothetical protein